VFAGVDADLFVTGEMSHHEALAVVERGSVVVCTGHGVSERGFLGRVREALREALGEELKKEAFEAIGEVGVGISAVDRDPFGWVVRR
jgi:import inner membrane translocase subunit TIM54